MNTICRTLTSSHFQRMTEDDRTWGLAYYKEGNWNPGSVPTIYCKRCLLRCVLFFKRFLTYAGDIALLESETLKKHTV